jgi:hypothetical protein
MWKDTEIAYLAGMIDGEGSIYIQRRITKAGYMSYFPRFQVVNTNQEVMEWIQNTFGGNLYKKPRTKHNEKWRLCFEWFSTVGVMDELLPLIIPYLIIKKQHALVMMQFRATFKSNNGSTGVTPVIQDFRLECMQKIKHLNHPIFVPSPLSP